MQLPFLKYNATKLWLKAVRNSGINQTALLPNTINNY